MDRIIRTGMGVEAVDTYLIFEDYRIRFASRIDWSDYMTATNPVNDLCNPEGIVAVVKRYRLNNKKWEEIEFKAGNVFAVLRLVFVKFEYPRDW